MPNHFVKAASLKAFCWLGKPDTHRRQQPQAACVWDMPSRKVIRTIIGENGDFGGPCSIAPKGRIVGFSNASFFRLRSLDDGRLLTTVVTLSDDPQYCAFLSPDGHWRGKPELADQFVYVVQTPDGRC